VTLILNFNRFPNNKDSHDWIFIIVARRAVRRSPKEQPRTCVITRNESSKKGNEESKG
jgi:hypothetical protein